MRYHELLQAAGCAVFLADRSWKIIDANRALADLLKCSEEEVLGADLQRFFADRNEQTLIRRSLEEDGSVKSGKYGTWSNSKGAGNAELQLRSYLIIHESNANF